MLQQYNTPLLCQGYIDDNRQYNKYFVFYNVSRKYNTEEIILTFFWGGAVLHITDFNYYLLSTVVKT